MSLFGDWDAGAGDAGSRRVRRAAAIPDIEFDKGDRLQGREGDARACTSPTIRCSASRRRCGARSSSRSPTLDELDDGAMVVVGGVITGLARKFTKKGDQMAVFVLEDLESSIEVTVFPRTLQEQGHKLEDDVIVTVKGRLDRRDESRFGLDRPGRSRCWRARRRTRAQPLRLTLPPTPLDELKIHRLKRILRDHPGDSVVLIDIGQGKVLRLSDEFRVDIDRVGRRAAHGVRPRSRRPVVTS